MNHSIFLILFFLWIILPIDIFSFIFYKYSLLYCLLDFTHPPHPPPSTFTVFCLYFSSRSEKCDSRCRLNFSFFWFSFDFSTLASQRPVKPTSSWRGILSAVTTSVPQSNYSNRSLCHFCSPPTVPCFTFQVPVALLLFFFSPLLYQKSIFL